MTCVDRIFLVSCRREAQKHHGMCRRGRPPGGLRTEKNVVGTGDKNGSEGEPLTNIASPPRSSFSAREAPIFAGGYLHIGCANITSSAQLTVRHTLLISLYRSRPNPTLFRTRTRTDTPDLWGDRYAKGALCAASPRVWCMCCVLSSHLKSSRSLHHLFV